MGRTGRYGDVGDMQIHPEYQLVHTLINWIVHVLLARVIQYIHIIYHICVFTHTVRESSEGTRWG